jgi:hypothetical protein
MKDAAGKGLAMGCPSVPGAPPVGGYHRCSPSDRSRLAGSRSSATRPKISETYISVTSIALSLPTISDTVAPAPHIAMNCARIMIPRAASIRSLTVSSILRMPAHYNLTEEGDTKESLVDRACELAYACKHAPLPDQHDRHNPRSTAARCSISAHTTHKCALQ